MEKIYTYKNGTVHIKLPTEEQLNNIQKATESYLTRLALGGYLDGNCDKTGSINKK